MGGSSVQEALTALERVLGGAGIRGWLVGGTVRDRLLGRSSTDLDVVVESEARRIAERTADASGNPWFALSHEFGAYRIVGCEGHVDVAALRGGSLESDLSLRDFTMNAMASSLDGGEVIDPFAGRDHLEQKVLVPVSDSVFADDPLRLLRAARFAHVLGMSVAPATERLIRGEAWRLPGAAAERILSEVVLTMEAGRAATAVCRWSDLDLLEHVFPEAAETKARAPDRHRVLLAALAAMDELLDRPGLAFGRSWELLEERLDGSVDGLMSRPVALRLATLLSGNGSPPAGRAAEPVRAQRARAQGREGVCGRLHCSRTVAGLIETAAAGWRTVEFAGSEDARSRDRVSFLWRTEPYGPECLLLAAAWGMALEGSPLGAEERGTRLLSGARRLMNLWRNRLQEKAPPLPLDGTVLMDLLGLEPGPLLGEVLFETRLAWEAGELASESEARDHAARFLAARTGL